MTGYETDQPGEIGRPTSTGPTNYRIVSGGNQGGAWAACSCGWQFESDAAYVVSEAAAKHRRGHSGGGSDGV